MIPFFSDKYQKKCTKEVVTSYLEFLESLRSNARDQADSSFMSLTFQKKLRKALFQKDLDKFSTFKFYWLTLIERIVSLLQLHEEIEEIEGEKTDTSVFLLPLSLISSFLETQDGNMLKSCLLR